MLRTTVFLILAAGGMVGVPPAGPETPPAGGGPLLLVANKGDHTLGIIDPVAGVQVATVEQSGLTGSPVRPRAAGREGRLRLV